MCGCIARVFRRLCDAIGFILTINGSVIHIATAWALPSCLFSVGLRYLFDTYDIPLNGTSLMDGFRSFGFVLGFLLVFRTQMAYQRYWEGAKLLRMVRGQWMNAASCVVAFCSSAEDKQHEVEEFLHLFVRLMSLLFCTGLQQVADMSDETFEILDLDGLEEDSVRYLASRPEHERCAVVLQWIQRLIVTSLEGHTLHIAPPLATRIFQELGQGIMVVNQAGAITSVPFPFPYAQLMSILLLIHTCATPVVMAIVLEDVWWTAICTFVSVLVFWGINHIAVEIEMPFGDDTNDLQLKDMQKSINDSLLTLIDPMTQNPPNYVFCDDHREIEHVYFGPDSAGWMASETSLHLVTKRPRVSGVRGQEGTKRTKVEKAKRQGGTKAPVRHASVVISRASAHAAKASESHVAHTAPQVHSIHVGRSSTHAAKEGIQHHSQVPVAAASSKATSVEAKLPGLLTAALEQTIADRLASVDEHLGKLNKTIDIAAKDFVEYVQCIQDDHAQSMAIEKNGSVEPLRSTSLAKAEVRSHPALEAARQERENPSAVPVERPPGLCPTMCIRGSRGSAVLTHRSEADAPNSRPQDMLQASAVLRRPLRSEYPTAGST